MLFEQPCASYAEHPEVHPGGCSPAPAHRRRRAPSCVASTELRAALGALVPGGPVAPSVDEAEIAALVVVAEVEWLAAVHGLAADLAVYGLGAGLAWCEPGEEVCS